MRLYSRTFFTALALTAFGLTLIGCQQAPAAPAAAAATPAQAAAPPSTTTESSSSTRSEEVKSEASNPDASAEKTVTKESTTVKQQ